ncbi:MAG: chalcone isomerase family protein [Deferribacterales bacterium]
MIKRTITILVLLTLMPIFSYAVNLQPQVEIKNHTLILNGYGIRKKMFFSIYECGLYLPSKTSSYEDVIKVDNKNIRLHFLYKKLTPEDIKKTFKEAIEKNSHDKLDSNTIQKFLSFFTFDIVSGDKIDLYFDKDILTVYHNNKAIGSIENKILSKAIIDIYIGANPIDVSLKNKLLGN